MKKLACLLAALLLHVSFSTAKDNSVFIVEAENFQFAADWSKAVLHRNPEQLGLYVRNSNEQPTTVFFNKEGGDYFVWASSVDFADDNPRTRTATIKINLKPVGIAGRHGKNGFQWEKLGKATLDRGENILSISLNTACARIDAILFAKDPNFDPNKANLYEPNSRKKFNLKPSIKELSRRGGGMKIEKLSDVSMPKIFEISNRAIKVRFVQKKDSAGKTFFERAESLFKDGSWLPFESFSDEALLAYYAPKSEMYMSKYYFKWNRTRERLVMNVNGKEVDVGSSKDNPFMFGESETLRPTAVKKLSERVLELTYENGIFAKVSLDKNLPITRFDLTRQIEKDGYYSFGMLGFNSSAKDEFTAVEMPTVYQERRTMKVPHLVPSSILSHPICMVEKPFAGGRSSKGLVGLPEKFDFKWPHFSGSPYAFCLSSPDGKRVQSSIFMPVLGMDGSKKSAGEELAASFLSVSVASDWKDFLELVDTKIFDVTRLRETYDVSFSDTVCNIGEYLAKPEFSGWSKELKGRWNIEGQNVVTQSTPLTEISLSVLTEDENVYTNLSLPTFEYLLSRNSPHYSPYLMPGHSYFGPGCTKIAIPSPAWFSDTYAGADWLTGSANAWIVDMFRPAKIKPNSWHRQPDWPADLGLYLARPDEKLLEKIKSDTDTWLQNGFKNLSTNETNMNVFINVSLYPYWWYLPDLYEITGDKKYLDAATEGAFHSLSSLMVYPLPPDGQVDIYKGNKVAAYTHNMWKGVMEEKVGRDIQEAAKTMLQKDGKKFFGGNFFIMPQKKVDAFKVSRVGYGIEQHCTFVGGDIHTNNILMASWAPEMLRVYGYTKKDLLMKMSRHSIIGRFANFFGYYQRDFQDATLDPLYPYRGPDITCLYYHHAPCQFAAALDYFMAQLEIASEGAVKFPYVRQQGYVWFVDRIFGRPGKVLFDNNCKPVLSKTAARVDNPKVSTMLARADDGMWLILYNDSAAENETSLTLNAADKVMRGVQTQKPVQVFDKSSKKIGERKFFDDAKIKIAPMDIVALKIPADYSKGKPFDFRIPPVENGHRVFKDLPEGFGELHAFRIRSPFGKDSLYFVSTGLSHGANAKMKVSSPQIGAEIVRSEYPYEISIYPVAQNERVKTKIELFKDGKNVKTIDIADL